MKREWKGIWIPKEIWLNEKLTLQEKVFLVEIMSLDGDNGCFASNNYFAKFFNLSKTRVSLIIKSLLDKKCITSHVSREMGNRRIIHSLFKFSYIPSLRKVKDPLKQKLKHNNTFNNIINKYVLECLECGFQIKTKQKDTFMVCRKCKNKPIMTTTNFIRAEKLNS